jgi:chloramphenicol-sensitive protein RarD
MLGLLQYIGPTIQFSLGVLLFHAALTRGKLIGFVMIWSELAMYAAQGLWRRSQPA